MRETVKPSASEIWNCRWIALLAMWAIAFFPSPVFSWTPECKRDAMTDKVECQIYDYDAEILVLFLNSSKPNGVCVVGHDFPGRDSAIRIDGNKPIVIRGEACVSDPTKAAAIVTKMQSGATTIIRKYEWPDDFPKDVKGSLKGFNAALAAIPNKRQALN